MREDGGNIMGGLREWAPRGWADGKPMEPELVFRTWKRVDAEANSFREAIRIMDEEILRFVREHPDLVRAIVPDPRTTRALRPAAPGSTSTGIGVDA